MDRWRRRYVIQMRKEIEKERSKADPPSSDIFDVVRAMLRYKPPRGEE